MSLQTPLVGAATKGHFVIVKILLQAGADISLRTMYQGEEFDAEGIVKRELAKTRLAICSIWKGSFIPGDQVNSRLTPYIRMILDYQSNYEAITAHPSWVMNGLKASEIRLTFQPVV